MVFDKTRIVHCFSPIAGGKERVLILGSMPGEASLVAGQYYAHPRNQFWHIMSVITGADPAFPYEQRAAALSSCGIALWDVIESCRRNGSLDTEIDESSLKPNDFRKFFAKNRNIERIFFNGGPAERYYRKHVLPSLPPKYAKLPLVCLPSTSPANASWTKEEKKKAWQVLATYCRR